MSIPNYRVVLSFDADRKVFVARVPELEHCAGEGATRGEAVDRVEKEIEAQLQNMQERGQRPPAVNAGPPLAVDDRTWTGEVTTKVSKTLHRDLTWQARLEGVEADHLIGELLASALEARRQPRRGRSQEADGNQRGHDGRGFGGGGGRYQGIMDDRANFIEYVRGLEADGHGHGRPQSRGPQQQRPAGNPGGGGGGGGGGNPGGGGGNNQGRRRRGGRPGDKRWGGPAGDRQGGGDSTPPSGGRPGSSEDT